MQVRTTLANIEDLTWVVTEPLMAIVAVAVLIHAERPDLASHALSASFLMTIGQMGFWVGSDVLTMERHRETLELSVITPTPFVMVLFARILVISSVGLLGLFEGWLLIRGMFGVPLTIHHPWLLSVALIDKGRVLAVETPERLARLVAAIERIDFASRDDSLPARLRTLDGIAAVNNLEAESEYRIEITHERSCRACSATSSAPASRPSARLGQAWPRCTCT